MKKFKKLIQTTLLLIWLLPVMGIYYLSIVSMPEINPNIVRDLTFSDILTIWGEIWMSPGSYLSWLLSVILPISDNGIAPFIVSGLLFVPFCVWPFLNSANNLFLRRFLQGATILMVKPVSLEVTFNQAGINPFTKAETAGFTATGSLSRFHILNIT